MHAYRYRAIDSRGIIHNGVADANGTADLEARLSKLDLELLSCKKQKTSVMQFMPRGIRRRDLIIFCYHLEQTCRAGVPILESLTDFRDSTENARLRTITAAMLVAIEGGRTLSGAMQDHPAVFNDIFRSLISAGEKFSKRMDSGRIVSVDSFSLNAKRRVVPSRSKVCGPCGVCTSIRVIRPSVSGTIFRLDSTF